MGKQFEQSRGGSFRGAGRGGSRGGSSRGGPHRGFDQGPPSYVVPFATFVHRVQGNFLVKSSDPSRFPKFNRGVYLESKAKVGSVDQILGPVSAYYFSINPAEGVNPSSFQSGQVFYMNPQDLLSTDRVTKPQARMPRGPGGFGGRGGGRGGARGGFSRGGRGGSDRGRGAPRGRGFGGRGR